MTDDLHIPHGEEAWDTPLLAAINNKVNIGTTVPGLVAVGAGFDTTGVLDSAPAMNTILAEAATRDDKTVWVPGGLYRMNSGLTTFAGLRIRAAGADRIGQGGGTEFRFYGTGALFTNGSDDGQAWDAGNYNGPQNVTLDNIYLRCDDSIRTTPLSNGVSNYAPGRTAFKDWRGGGIKFRDVWLQGFEYGFWGVQSDVNHFRTLALSSCKVGVYLGPRSDQAILDGIYSVFSDTNIQVDGAHGTRITNLQSNGDGSSTVYPIQIGGGAWSRGSVNTVINAPWFEHYNGAGSATIDSFVGIGTAAGDTVGVKGVTINNPTILVSPSVVSAIATVGNALYVEVNAPNGDVNSVADLFRFVGTTSPVCRARIHRNHDIGFTNSGSGTPDVQVDAYGFGSNMFKSQNGRINSNYTTANVLRDHYMVMGGDRLWQILIPGDSSGNTTKLQFSRRRTDGTAAPTTGTWIVGDYCANNAPAVGQPTGWYCTVAGTPGTWVAAANL